MKRIIFVDDEPNVLEGLKRMLFPLHRQWKMAFVSSGEKALQLMDEEPFDIIVSDMRMPGMDGAQLLAEVKRRHPGVVRFVLTGQSDLETVYRSVGDAHQFLMKPCKPKLLQECVDRTFALRDLLKNESLKAVVSRIGALPPLPRLYHDLCEELQSSQGSVSRAAQIIESDPAMTAKILQLVNSAFFGVRQHVSSAVQAATLLGFDRIRALVLTTQLFETLGEAQLPDGFSIGELWRHSGLVSEYASAIALSEGAPREMVNDAFTAGLLHDSGLLVLAAATPSQFQQIFENVRRAKTPIPAAEQDVLGCTHAEIGAYLLGIWGLPDPVVSAVAYHANPGAFPGTSFSPVTAVHAADAIASEGPGEKPDGASPHLDMGYLRSIGLDQHVPAWKAVCAKTAAAAENPA